MYISKQWVNAHITRELASTVLNVWALNDSKDKDWSGAARCVDSERHATGINVKLQEDSGCPRWDYGAAGGHTIQLLNKKQQSETELSQAQFQSHSCRR